MSAIITTDTKGTIVSASAAAASLFGFSFGELIGADLKMLMPPAFAKQHDSYMKRFLDTRVAKVIDKRRMVSGLHKNGRILHLQLSLSVLALDDKTLFIGLLQPVVLRTVKVYADHKCDIVRCSKNVFEMFGVRTRDLIGQNVSVLCAEPHRSLHGQYLERYLLTGQTRVLGLARNVNARHVSGREVPISLQVQPYPKGFKARIYPLDGVDVMLTVEDEKVVLASDKCRILFGSDAEELKSSNFDSLFIGVVPSTIPLATTFFADLKCKDGATVKISIEKNSLDAANRFSFRVASIECANNSSSESEDGDTSEDGAEAAAKHLGLYEMGGVLGEGFFGSVRMAKHKLSGLPVAVKKLRRSQFEEIGMRFPPLEVRLLRAVPPHSNLVQLFDIIETESTVYLIQEFVKGGELFDYCLSTGALRENELKRLFGQLVRGVSWLHKAGIVHRDLKLENCLLDAHQNLRLIDLGLGTFFDNQEHLRTFCGSPDYAAPELYMRKLYLGPPVDVWAMGVMLFVMATSYVPFRGPQNVVDIDFSWPREIALSDELKDLVERIFVLRPNERITLKELRSHAFVQLPKEELSEESIAIDTRAIDQLVVEMGVSRELVLQSISSNEGGDTPCNAINAGYRMLKMCHEKAILKHHS